jgi:predicted PurR-regulated permease PerM/methylmalonyl-CoA mutase cobalamin-binding subunit
LSQSVPQTSLLGRVNGPWVSLLTLVLVVGVLWAAKAILLPLAIGIILAFALTPLVRQFDRWHFPRAAGVALTLVLAFGAVGGIGYVVFDQFSDLSMQITRYTSSMRQKVSQLRMADDAALRQLSRTVNRVTEQLDDNVADLRRAQPVRIVPPRPSPMERLRQAAAGIFEPLASTVIVLALVAFMLGQREDLRDRFIRLIGADNVTLTTRLMDEAAHRVSQFLVWQTLINLVFGAIVAAGLYWIGVPYAALWGGLTAVLRFVPYVGSLLSALGPATLAFATFPGWTPALQTIALFLTLDVLTAWFAEPLVFGRRTGVSSFALLISALFWIWVWGPVGLLLATPLTVCIAVLGRHVRSLRFLAVIFADEPALTPQVRFYQRLLARDEDEAGALVDRKMHELGPVAVFDEMLIPALLLSVQHRVAGEITKEDAAFILDFVKETLHELTPQLAKDEACALSAVGVASPSRLDRLVLQMLRAALLPHDVDLISTSSIEEALAGASERRTTVICVASISSTRSSEIRNYCRQIRRALPQTRIVVLGPYLADTELSRSNAKLMEAGANVVMTSMSAAVAAVLNLLQDAQKVHTAQLTSAPEEPAAASTGASLAAGLR